MNTKLRDSCSACASSKVKCSKEKPACSRCAKRGTACNYLVTRRPGRKHQQAHAINPRPPSINTTHTFDNLSSSSSASPIAVQQTTICGDDILPVSSELFNGLLSPLDPLSTPDFADFFAPSVSLPLLPDSSELDLLDTPLVFFGDQSENQNTTTKDSVGDTIYLFGSGQNLRKAPRDQPSVVHPDPSERFALPSPRPSIVGPNSRPLETPSTQHQQEIDSGSPTCTCLTRTLDLLKLLVAGNVPQQASSRDGLVADGQLETVNAVSAMNKQITDVLSAILQCSCSTDTYLLTIASLVVFKMINCYAQVAYGPTAAHDFNHDGEDLGRVAAQSVLGELHLVQRLVNQLSSRLRASISRKPSIQEYGGFRDQSPSPTRASGITLTFSHPMLDQLEQELRSGIHSLSSEIIRSLQQD